MNKYEESLDNVKNKILLVRAAQFSDVQRL